MAFCKNCNGVRKVDCVMCNGSGKAQNSKKCEFCHGQGKLPCPACDKANLAVELAAAAVSAIPSKQKLVQTKATMKTDGNRKRNMGDIVAHVHNKAYRILRKLTGKNGPFLHHKDLGTRITNAFAQDSESIEENDGSIGFHMLDWQGDAATLIAMYRFSERFTDEEIRIGVTQFLIHAPYHLVRAASIVGFPVHSLKELKQMKARRARRHKVENRDVAEGH